MCVWFVSDAEAEPYGPSRTHFATLPLLEGRLSGRANKRQQQGKCGADAKVPAHDNSRHHLGDVSPQDKLLSHTEGTSDPHRGYSKNQSLL
jgi:hypothetical protein